MDSSLLAPEANLVTAYMEVSVQRTGCIQKSPMHPVVSIQYLTVETTDCRLKADRLGEIHGIVQVILKGFLVLNYHARE